MLKNIKKEQLRLGMYLHALDGSWFDHPFWRSKFVLEDPADLKAILESDVTSLTIDESKGLAAQEQASLSDMPQDISAPSQPVTAKRGAPRLPASPKVDIEDNAPSPGANAPCSEAEERKRASKLVEKSKPAVVSMFNEARLGKAIKTAKLSMLVDQFKASIERNSSALINIARLKTKDEYTYMHSVAVCALMINLARQMKLDESLIQDIGMAGLLHDVGKMKIPEQVLNKAGRLTDDEFTVIRTHPERGHEMLKKSGNVPDIALDVCLHHHEKMDGTGYPFRLKAKDISIYARMGAICDVYDAITSDRPYKAGWHPSESIARMLSWEGHFDQNVLRNFVRSIGIYPVGTLVRLRSNRLAAVLDSSLENPMAPAVRAFYSTIRRKPIPIEDIQLNNANDDEEILGPEIPMTWGFAEWPSFSQRLLALDLKTQ